MKKFDISIIMPTFKQGKYIAKAVDSVLRQTNVRVQLIIIDGQSPDDTMKALVPYLGGIDTLVSEPDRGQADALNKALEYVQAPLVGWLNSDDFYVGDNFDIAIREFSASPNLCVLHGRRILVNAQEEVIGWATPGQFDPKNNHFNICSETAFWRRSLARDTKFNENLQFAMDLDFFCKLWGCGEFKYLRTYLGAFRLHDDAKSSTMWQSHAVPEASEIWTQHFSRPYSPNNRVAEFKAAWLNKIIGFSGLPMSGMLSYSKQRGTRLASNLKR